MSKINNTKIKYGIVYGLGTLIILAFWTIVTPVKVNADEASYVTPYNSTAWNEVAVQDNNQYYYPTPYFSHVAPYNSTRLNEVQTNGQSNYPGGVTNDSPTPANTANPSSNASSSNTSTDTSNEDTNQSGLAAAAVFGTDSALPSGIIQWILFAIIILLIVILVRRISGGTERYHNSPLKHA